MIDEQDKLLSQVTFSGTDDKVTEPAGATMALAQTPGAITLFI